MIVKQLPVNVQIAIGSTDLGNTQQLIKTRTWIEGIKKGNAKQETERNERESWRNRNNYNCRQNHTDN